MRKNFKVLISILLCFMMLFGEIVPAGLPSAKALAETDNVLEVQDSSFNQENNNFSPERLFQKMSTRKKNCFKTLMKKFRG